MSDELIEVVRSYELLYNPKCKDYKDQSKRTAAWDEISHKLKLPVEKCKETWAKLRNAYCSALKRRKTKSGQAASQGTPWKYEGQMGFLRPHMEMRNTQTNLILPSPPSPAETDAPESPAQFSSYSPTTVRNETQSSATSHSRSSSSLKRKPDLEDIYKMMKTSHDLRQQKQQSKQDMDETDMFFLSMSKAVKALTKLDQTKIKLDLHMAIFQAEIRKITEMERVSKIPLNIPQMIVSPCHQTTQSPTSIQLYNSPSSYDSSSGAHYYQNSPTETQAISPESQSILDHRVQHSNSTVEENLLTYYNGVNLDYIFEPLSD